MGQSPLITESLWCGSTESVVWFMLTYWGLIWARLQPHGSICSGSEVRMSWNKINRQPRWRPGMMVNWRICPCWMSLLDHFNYISQKPKKTTKKCKTEMFMTKCLIYYICVSVNQLNMSKTEFLRQRNIFLLYTRLSTIINHIKQSFCIFLLC